MYYTVNMDYQEIVKLSPYPISEMPLNRHGGLFRWGSSINHHPYSEPEFKPSIEIHNDLLPTERPIMLIHELGHALHYKKHCKCFTGKDKDKRNYLVELHAYRFTLRFLIRHKMISELKFEYNAMINHTYSEIYQRVIKKIKTEKLWEKVKKTLDIQ